MQRPHSRQRDGNSHNQLRLLCCCEVATASLPATGWKLWPLICPGAARKVATASLPATGWKLSLRLYASSSLYASCNGLTPGNGMETYKHARCRHADQDGCNGLTPGNGMETGSNWLSGKPRGNVATASLPATGWKLGVESVRLPAPALLQRPHSRQRDGNYIKALQPRSTSYVATASLPATGWKPGSSSSGLQTSRSCNGLTPGNGMETLIHWQHWGSSPEKLQRPHSRQRDGNTPTSEEMGKLVHVATASLPATGWKPLLALVRSWRAPGLQRPHSRQRDGNMRGHRTRERLRRVATASLPATGWKQASFGLRSDSRKKLQRPHSRQRDGNTLQPANFMTWALVATASLPATGWKPSRGGWRYHGDSCGCNGLTPGNGMETGHESAVDKNGGQLQRPHSRQRDGNDIGIRWANVPSWVATASLPATGWKPLQTAWERIVVGVATASLPATGWKLAHLAEKKER